MPNVMQFNMDMRNLVLSFILDPEITCFYIRLPENGATVTVSSAKLQFFIDNRQIVENIYRFVL